MARLEEDLYLAKPDVVIVISPHGNLMADAFTVNFCNEYETDLREFGDLTTRMRFKSSGPLATTIWEHTKAAPFNTAVICQQSLDHGVAVPLYYLLQHLPNIGILPMGFATELDAKTHLDFGTLMKEFIMNTNKRIAVIASGDLSHALSNTAPAGFNPRAEEFDAAVQKLLAARNTAGVVQMDLALVEAASECGLRSILILLGILRNINYTFEAYSYEAPFGVGYLTANFVL